MNTKIKKSMYQYYDERADEYDELYTLGKGPASITDSTVYRNDVVKIKQSIKKQNIKGIVFDVPSGTGFWMSSYHQKADQIILIDQSARMLKKAKERAKVLDCIHKCQFFKIDAFQLGSIELRPAVYLIGFFISHLTPEEESQFFSLIKNKISREGKIIILDSAWSNKRVKTRKKEGRQVRKLNNGTAFDIYKRYLTKEDLRIMSKRESLNINIEYFGDAFL